jgi:diguanylate cyclase (GGDEF)-like protein
MTVIGRLPELRTPPWLIALLTLPALALVAALDSRYDVSVRLTVLYLLPVTIAAWTGRRGPAAAVAVAGALTQFVVDLTVAPGHRGLALWNLLADLVVYLGAALFVVAIRRRLTEADHEARTDALTGLANLRAFRAAAEAELVRARRYGRRLSVALVDLDGFKQINDTHGHAVGDDVLRAVARHLARSVRSSDVVARVGGDEFAVLLPETGKEEAAAALRHVGTGAGIGSHAVDFSVGIVSYEEPPESVDQVLAEADREMYRQKRRRRGVS